MSRTPRARAESSREYLLRCGWIFNPSRAPWSWSKPPLTGTFYRLKDAVKIESSSYRGKK